MSIVTIVIVLILFLHLSYTGCIAADIEPKDESGKIEQVWNFANTKYNFIDLP